MCAASIARKIYLRAGTGVGAFRKIYGGNKNKGTRKEHFQKASGGMIRSILLNLESMGVVEKMEDGYVPSPVAPARGCRRCGSRGAGSGAGRDRRGRLRRCSRANQMSFANLCGFACSGRKITKKGQKDLDLVATTLSAPAAEY